MCRTTDRLFLIGCTALVSAAMLSTPAIAESAGGEAGGVATVDELVITARKKTERLLDVPVTASALNREALERYAASDLTSMAAQVTQVSIDEAGSGNGAIITVRGVGSASVDGGIDQAVTVNLDGVPISRGRVVNQASFDQQSVEVLKGPQALYFGKNSPAGVISINSAGPGDAFEGYARAGYEFDAREYFGEFAAGGPLSDSLRARVAVRGSRMDGGYIRNIGGPITDPAVLPYRLTQAGFTLPGAPYRDYSGAREVVGRVTVVYEPSDRFDMTLKLLASDHEDRGYSMTNVMFSCGPGQTAPMSLDSGNPTAGRYLVDPYGSCERRFKNSQGTIPASVAAAYPGSKGGTPFTDVVSHLGSLTSNYKISDAITVTAVTGYYKYTEKQWSNYDYTAFATASGQNDDAYRSWSQEVRLASSFDTPLNFTAGLFFQSDKRLWVAEGSVGYRGPDPATGRWSSAADSGDYRGKTYSAFAELNWHITPTLELAGGARYTHEKRTAEMRNTYVHAAYAAAFLSPAILLDGRVTDENVSPQVTLSWHPAPNILVFGGYREGFKSGGFSSPTRFARTATAENQAFGPESVSGWDGGLKLSRGPIMADFAVYRYVFKGLQLTSYNTVTTSYFTQNAGSALVYGAEANVTYRVTRDFSVRGSVGYNHANYEEFPGAQCWTGQTASEGCVAGVQDLGGRRLARAPRLNAFLGVSYDPRLTDDLSLGLSADVRHSSGYFLNTNDSPFGYQDPFTTLNVSARIYNQAWELALIGKNLTNEFYAVSGGDKPLGPRGQTTANVGRPRQVILQVTRRF